MGIEKLIELVELSHILNKNNNLSNSWWYPNLDLKEDIILRGNGFDINVSDLNINIPNNFQHAVSRQSYRSDDFKYSTMGFLRFPRKLGNSKSYIIFFDINSLSNGFGIKKKELLSTYDKFFTDDIINEINLKLYHMIVMLT